MYLKSGYIIDEIFDLYFENLGYTEFDKALEEFSRFCSFELLGVEDYKLNIDSEKSENLILLAYNIINRGNPTRASLFITENILLNYGFTKENDKTNSIVFTNLKNNTKQISNWPLTFEDLTKPNNKVTYDCIYIPILIGQIQKTFLLLLLNNIVSLSKKFLIHCNENLRQYFSLAFEDLFQLIENLYLLADKQFERPEIRFVNTSIANFSLGIAENGYKYKIRPIQNIDTPLDKVLTAKKLRYNPIGEYDSKNKFIVYESKKKYNKLFFRKLF